MQSAQAYFEPWICENLELGLHIKVAQVTSSSLFQALDFVSV